MNHIEKYAYLAGIIDGEGTISIFHYKRLNRHYLTFEVYNNCKKLIDWLETNIGGYSRPITSASRSTKINWKTTYVWRLQNNECLEVLRNLLPFLVSKKEQCEIAIKFKESFLKRECPISKETAEYRKSLYERIKPLNQRGLTVPPCLPTD